MNKIDAQAKSITDLLSNKKYTVDYYQREYKWEAKQIIELLEDLEANFLNNYEEGHPRSAVEDYKHYFLGSIIVSARDGKKFIIDGQQRLTSITLLLIYLHNLQQDRPEAEQVDIGKLIFSEKYGKKSFNLDIDERAMCIEALYNQHAISFDVNNESESIRNILARYDDIESNFPPTLANGRLPYFIDWLKENVDLVEITTSSDEDAYTIFETMNDRGLSLSPTDMLKGYLLANIADSKERASANSLWKEQIFKLTRAGKEEDADFFKAWLRAKYASTIRERKKGSTPGDFDIIGTTFHKWVHDQSRFIELNNTEDFLEFVTKQMKFFSSQYIRIREAAETLTPGMEYIYYNAHNNFTLQYPLLLAPLRSEDDADTTQRKIRLVAGYLDIFIARRAVNFRTMDYSSIVYTMFNFMKEIRELDVHSLARLLKQKVVTMENSFAGVVPWFRLNLWSKRYIHHILARMTHYIETQCGIESSFVAYTSKTIKKPFEIEHIWSNKYSYHQEEIPNKEDFDIYRSRFGGLLLLPRGFNQSFGDKSYSEKMDHYYGQNLLARSLHPLCYQNNPSFLHFVEQSGLPFRPHETFTKEDLDERQRLYQLICEQIWSPNRFDQELQ
ncbi:hypothetical protein KSD_47660 [Ktedonobacter sp. SOSP1-85]|uniref:DUF262 domain-containing protein n=1 Tax=Ktedonobacter sp. SOSP1-85 TaxID=2778367 RepID=UPI0019158EFB|nr:DUF262 domain-containing protein [Ktedonobacter sp. SOSP1-85]GHO76995.1 hypothetical protein KSD_47660 [Ktedonobacter sp. SOSP1-85]